MRRERLLSWLFSPRDGLAGRLAPRWLFLRALGLIYFSAFYSLAFQIRGLIGPSGILPAGEYLAAVARAYGAHRLWFAPTLLWFSSSSTALMVLCWAGLIASLLLVVNLWPRAMLAVCFVCFLSFVTAAGDFSSYQSDGMLLEAGFIALFLAPGGLRPGLGADTSPSRASYFLLLWEWFRIYFESGLVKLLSGDPEWRHFTAMDDYYQNGPLPTWIGWYVAHLPHWFHAGTVALTLGIELGLVWMAVLPRRWRLICFWIVTPWEVGVILTGNYAFLNYLVLILGFLLLDDGALRHWLPGKIARLVPPERIRSVVSEDEAETMQRTARHFSALRLAVSAVLLTWVGYTTSYLLIAMLWREAPLPQAPVAALEPLRIANQYGLFAVMTRGRYEIEFQGSNDGQTWIAYPFRYKPQAVNEAPGIYAPYQPRFDWNLWFASLGDWRQYPIVPNTETSLLTNDVDVLSLFRSNPFPDTPPKMVRAVLWRYWFTPIKEKRASGNWWRRRLLGTYAPTIERQGDGHFSITQLPTVSGPHE